MSVPTTDGSPRLRLTVLLIVVGCLFVALVARLWFLQVLQAPAARAAVATTGVVNVYTPAPRGEILDRNGVVLVDNVNVPTIDVEREEASNTPMLARLAALLGMTEKSLKQAVANVEYSPYQSVPVYEHATASQILYIEEHAGLFPGVTTTTLSVPHVTAWGEYAAAILGYVGPIPASEWPAYKKRGYQPTDVVGLAGVEESFQRQLAGKPGVTRIQVNAQNQPLGVLSQTPPVPGDNIRLSINIKVQKEAVDAIHQGQAMARTITDSVTHRKFTSPAGSVVAEDPKNGQILALATVPTYNPNEFDDGGISQAQYKALLDDPDDPLIDRAIQGEYAPGSTFKLVTATAGLHYNLITPTSPFDDTGSIKVGGQVFHDDGGAGAGVIDLPTAITVSSDNYFNEIGIEFWNDRGSFGDDALQKVADSYGFNSSTGIALPDESPGLIPTPQILQTEHDQYPSAYPYPEWFTGYSAETAIGQFQVEVTPLQLANAYSAFANGGTLYVPQIALDAETAKGTVVKRYQPVVKGHPTPLTPAQRQAMIQGFQGVVNSPGGTAYYDFAGTNLAGEDIAGKTGTAQVTGAGKQDTSVFTSFGPASHPDYVVDCFMEDSGYGATVAAPVVRDVWQQLLHKALSPITYNALTADGNQL